MQITQATLWNLHLTKFLFHINYALGATRDKGNDFVYLISKAGDAVVHSGSTDKKHLHVQQPVSQ